MKRSREDEENQESKRRRCDTNQKCLKRLMSRYRKEIGNSPNHIPGESSRSALMRLTTPKETILLDIEYDSIREEVLARYFDYRYIVRLFPRYFHERKMGYIAKEPLSTLDDIYRLLFRDIDDDWNYAVRSRIKKKLKKKDLKILLGKWADENEILPKLYPRMLEYLYKKLAGKDPEADRKKRQIESENMGTVGNRIFVSLCGVVVPDEIMGCIFEYVKQNKTNLDTIGCVSENWYLLFLRGWNFLGISRDNMKKIPVVCLNSTKKIVVNVLGIFKSEFEYFHKNTQAVQKICLTSLKREKNFFNALKIVKRNCDHLKVTNLFELKIDKKYFPNLRKFTFRNYSLPRVPKSRGRRKPKTTKKVKELKMNWRTLELLKNVRKISIRNSYLDFRKPEQYLPDFMESLQNLRELSISPLSIDRICTGEDVVRRTDKNSVTIRRLVERENIFPRIAKLQSLQKIKLFVWEKDFVEQMQKLVEQLPNMPMLTEFGLRSIDSWSSITKEILEEVNKIPQFKVVTLEWNKDADETKFRRYRERVMTAETERAHTKASLESRVKLVENNLFRFRVTKKFHGREKKGYSFRNYITGAMYYKIICEVIEME